ncbi:transposase [Streptomyces sp. NPDC096311]|uniref:transposase n=1 Tax=Streptomyces sp. NPDC096311 TaxID=3366083 RepID=UPI0037F4B278
MAKQYPKELKERAVRLVLETRDQYKTESAAIRSIGAKLDIRPESLRNWVRQAEVDAGARTGTTTEESAQLKALKKTTGPGPGPGRGRDPGSRVTGLRDCQQRGNGGCCTEDRPLCRPSPAQGGGRRGEWRADCRTGGTGLRVEPRGRQ